MWVEYHRPRSSILVHTMGKVGSSTVARSLNRSSIDLPVYHTHFLSQDGINRVEARYRDDGLMVPAHIRRSQDLRWRVSKGETGWLVVSLVRDPIARSVSDLFQNASTLWPELVDDNGNVDPDLALEWISSRLASFDEETDYVCTWFDQEMQPVFNIDVFDTSFDHERGYTVCSSSVANLLLLRLEDLNSVFQPAMRTLLPDQPEVEMVRANVRSDKTGPRTTYQTVKDEMSLPLSTVERIYDSRFVRHFYTASMVDTFIDRWT